MNRVVSRVFNIGVGALSAGLLVCGNASAQKVYYRYHNSQGQIVQTDRLLPDIVPLGYSVVSASGDVLQVVPRELTKEEKRERDEAAAQDRARQAELERMRKWDQSLILRYSSAEEIEAARERGVKEFDTRISILQGSLLALKTQIETEQGAAANHLRRGRSVPEPLTERIAELKAEVAYAEGAIDKLQRERSESVMQFDRDKVRFAVLMKQAQTALAR